MRIAMNVTRANDNSIARVYIEQIIRGNGGCAYGEYCVPPVTSHVQPTIIHLASTLVSILEGWNGGSHSLAPVFVSTGCSCAGFCYPLFEWRGTAVTF